MKAIKYYITIISLFISSCIIANNVQVANIQLINNDAANKQCVVDFDISWENSWRISAGPNNWDAVWIFAKYKVGDAGEWKHAKFDATATNHSIINNNGVDGVINPSSDSLGVFMYRMNDGSGNINWENVNLLWKYSSDPSVGNDYVEVKIFALEMVNVPQGSFYLGDGAGVPALGALGRFHPANDTNAVYQINNENGFYLGGFSANNLTSNDDANAVPRTEDDFGGADSSYLPDAFPKGFDEIYAMKHELSQEGYVEFLNTLTRIQQDAHTATDISGTAITNRYVMSNTATVEYRNGIKCDAVLPATGAITFYCDLNGNDVYNEVDDGQSIACNLIEGLDISAYADWAGLRWMTELEYEKIARGPSSPVAEEFAWGNVNFVAIDDVLNSGQDNEVSNTAGANYNYGSAITGGTPYQPIRPGIFATASSSDRETANASYYGILDLSGNLQEPCITVGNSAGRLYVDNHGDGNLETNGDANVATWPIAGDSYGTGRRGGAWKEPYLFGRISNRFYGAEYVSWRSEGNGLRLVRTAP